MGTISQKSDKQNQKKGPTKISLEKTSQKLTMNTMGNNKDIAKSQKQHRI